ncbi:multicopper oxidase domain-containing protein [Methylocaldum sp.]|uniref:multicopper oxidase domain-containing protein n=1 Tax=Methylocaldum sp. TaxID=1969727 RepID=UPI002D30C177|nr:multicopper oxidase domain-containing protein [Methylocaldum sp.]HYE36395.1 multicopper oxidase domain-containing protein [Methylocaldum sp.]
MEKTKPLKLRHVLPWCLAALFGQAEAATQNFTLYVSSGTWPINGAGGAVVNVWGYGDQAASPKIPGPALTVYEGDTVNLTVVNNHSLDHNLVIQGVSTDLSAIPPGGSKIYSFTAPSAGTYLYSDTLNNNVNREMGLYGAFVVRPADGSNSAWTGGPAYTFERTWVVSDMDKPRWNDVAGLGGTVDTAVYKPTHFLINGLGGFDGMMDAATTIDGMVGETALVRIINAGQYSQSLHFHANHFKVLTSNGVRQSSPYQELDTINVPPMTTADVLFYLNQPGHYPMHNHTSQMETANGVYLNGVSTMIMMH